VVVAMAFRCGGNDRVRRLDKLLDAREVVQMPSSVEVCFFVSFDMEAKTEI